MDGKRLNFERLNLENSMNLYIHTVETLYIHTVETLYIHTVETGFRAAAPSYAV
jgi:hypothetical protein